MQLKPAQNPLFDLRPADAGDMVIDAKKLKSPYTVKGKTASAMEIRKLLRKQTAAQAIGQLYPQCSIFGITKGQFSLVELIAVILQQTGPADVFLSTWTAAGGDLTEAHGFIESGAMRSFRCLVDNTFQRRKPAFAARIRELFGIEAIRVTRNHAKFCLIRNEKWSIVINTSMNLNSNPRLEDFLIQDNAALADFLQNIMDAIFKRIKPRHLYDSCKDNEERFKKLWDVKKKVKK